MIRAALGLALALALTPLGAAAQERVVSLGGAVTEIVAALGEGDRLVGRDTTSTVPEPVRALPDLGYFRALSPEGVLSVRPDLILAEEGAGPPATVELLRSGGVTFVTVPDAFDAEGVAARIRTVGEALGAGDRADALAAAVTEQLAQVAAEAETRPHPRVLFVLAADGGRILASGTGTAADAMIRLAGGVNAVDGFEGYKPLTSEALAGAAPEVILMMNRGVADPESEPDDDKAIADLLAQPALAATPAGRGRRVVRMDGLYLLGFGPRTADAARDLSRALTE
ncbi:ABC transporter substrate-binding protein [Paracoccus sp. Z118]|uniref:heme/hemin ABC transporter substrate-binding protein n=1 Tax=Paracoccus sp. Z118 TaxID=2851017 RepID=UPI001C2BF33C|nr:ABC transporter substrate-binding protein [Paracoccus sp. Z118]MBV0892698.1 ABC transporter substrate-binding protein [Paracoccus sp. Z118]